MPKKSNPRPSVTRAKSDRDVIKAFVDKRPAEGKKLSTNGRRLDGNWMGGSNLASWKGDKIELHDIGSKAADAVQRQIRKTVPKSWLKANPIRNADDDEDEEDITEHELYDDVKDAIQTYVNEEANRNAATAHSTIDDQLQIDLEEEGFDDQNIWKIATFGHQTAVDGDVLISPYWEKELKIKKDVSHPVLWDEAPAYYDGSATRSTTALWQWLQANGYERVSNHGGEWPGGVEAEIEVDGMVQYLSRENGWDQDFVAAVVEAMQDHRDLYISRGYIYQTSDDGDIEVWAKLHPDSAHKIRVIMRGGKSAYVDAPEGVHENNIGDWLDVHHPNWVEWERVTQRDSNPATTRHAAIAERLARGI